MRITTSVLACLLALTLEMTSAEQVRRGDVKTTDDTKGREKGAKATDIKIGAVESNAKSKKKKDSINLEDESFDDDDDGMVDDDDGMVDDDGAADDDGWNDDDGAPGDFQLRDLFFPCQLLQAQFDLPISCRVDIFESIESDGRVGVVVELNDPVCTPTILNRDACVRHSFSTYFGLSNFALSSRVDFKDITVGEFELGDVGLELEACPIGSGLTNVFCGCEASYNGNACSSCRICGLGNGGPLNAVEFDCTNLVPLLSNFNACEEINVIQTLKGDRIPVSVPNFIRELTVG